MQVSPVIRIVAIVGVLAILALGAGIFFMSRAAASAEASAAEPLPNVMRRGSAPAVKQQTKRVPANAVAAKTPVKAAPPAVKLPQPRPVAKAVPARPKVELNEGLAPAIAAALGRSNVVVVALYAPDAAVDRISRDESRAGARDARVGFVALNVLDQAQGGALTAALGMLDAPAVLVYKRPGTIVVHLEGFADRQTVAQAAANARA